MGSFVELLPKGFLLLSEKGKAVIAHLRQADPLDGFAQVDFVRQEIVNPVVGGGAGQGPDLVRQGYDECLDRCEQDVLGQRIRYACSSSDVSDGVLRTGVGILQGLEPGRRDADHGVAPGQPDAAGRLTPERLGFDDLTKLPVVRAVVPCAATQMPYLLFH